MEVLGGAERPRSPREGVDVGLYFKDGVFPGDMKDNPLKAAYT